MGRSEGSGRPNVRCVSTIRRVVDTNPFLQLGQKFGSSQHTSVAAMLATACRDGGAMSPLASLIGPITVELPGLEHPLALLDLSSLHTQKILHVACGMLQVGPECDFGGDGITFQSRFRVHRLPSTRPSTCHPAVLPFLRCPDILLLPCACCHVSVVPAPHALH